MIHSSVPTTHTKWTPGVPQVRNGFDSRYRRVRLSLVYDTKPALYGNPWKEMRVRIPRSEKSLGSNVGSSPAIPKKLMRQECWLRSSHHPRSRKRNTVVATAVKTAFYPNMKAPYLTGYIIAVCSGYRGFPESSSEKVFGTTD